MASEAALLGGVLLIITGGLIWKHHTTFFHAASLLVLVIAAIIDFVSLNSDAATFFSGSVRSDGFARFLQLLFGVAGMFTVAMSITAKHQQTRLTEYYAMILSVILGARILVMSENLVIAFVSLEVISIASYILTGFSFTKKATEGSLKYFLFGSTASAVMLYGFSLLYGITGTVQFTSIEFLQGINDHGHGLVLVASTLALAGFLYKIAAVPMHPWAPDVYEAASMPVIALFSVVPKLAGLGILTRFLVIMNFHGKPDWQLILAVIILATLTVGNFSALWQKNVKRLMAYSSIAQSGFLLVALVTFDPRGLQYMLFYAAVYMILNFLVFIMLQYFEENGATTIAEYGGAGKVAVWPSICLLVGMIGLTGLPPTAGFTSKVFIFSALWESYSGSGKTLLLWVLIFGLLNTVVSLFYYLRLPYYAFVRPATIDWAANKSLIQNFLGAILVVFVLLLFFSPGLLMGWINKITFAY